MKLTLGPQRTHLFLRFFIPYTILLVTTLALGVVFHLQAKRFIQEEVIKSNVAVLEQTRDLIDKSLRDLDQIVAQIRQNRDLTKLKYTEDPFAADRVMWVIQAVRNLYAHGAGNPMIYDYFVLFPRSDLVIGSQKAYSLEYFYTQVLPIPGMSLAEFRRSFVTNPTGPTFLPLQTAYIGDGSKSVVAYLGSLESVDSTNALVIVLIDLDYLTHSLKRIDLSRGGMAAIHDGSSVIASLGEVEEGVFAHPWPNTTTVETAKIGPERMIIATVPSAYNSWRFVAVQPTRYVLSKVIVFRNLAVLILLAAIVIDLSLSIYLARRSSRPVLSVLEIIAAHAPASAEDGPAAQSTDEFAQIRTALEDLIRRDHDLSTRLAAQRLAVQTTVLNRLLDGGYRSEAEAKENLEAVGIVRPAAYYCVTVFRFDSPSQDGRPRGVLPLGIPEVAIAEATTRVFGANSCSHVVGAHYPAVILYMDSPDYLVRRRRLKDVVANLGLLASPAFVVGVGDFCSALIDLNRSHEEARIAASGISKPGDAPAGASEQATIREFHDLDLSGSWFFYPQEVDARLSMLMSAGQDEELAEVLKSVAEENFRKRVLAPSVQRVLVESVCATFVRTARTVQGRAEAALPEIYHLVASLPRRTDLREAFEEVAASCFALATDSKQASSKQTMTLVLAADKILVDSHADPGLSLDWVSERLGVSTFHLSKSVSHHLGKTFQARLEEIRMAKARQALRESNRPIVEVAESVGYGSANSFAKAFRRVHGISASAYRRSERVL